MVQGIDPGPLDAHQTMEDAVGDDVDGLARQRRVQAGDARINVVDALVQAAEVDIYHLGAAADAEHRQVATGGAVEDLQLEGIALDVDAHRRLNVAAVECRVDIVAAADDEAIEALNVERCVRAQPLAAAWRATGRSG